MDEQMLVEQVIAGVDEVSANAAFASIRFMLPFRVSGVVGFCWQESESGGGLAVCGLVGLRRVRRGLCLGRWCGTQS